MIDIIEDVKTEFKYKLNESLEKEVIAFLNTDGGTFIFEWMTMEKSLVLMGASILNSDK